MTKPKTQPEPTLLNPTKEYLTDIIENTYKTMTGNEPDKKLKIQFESGANLLMALHQSLPNTYKGVIATMLADATERMNLTPTAKSYTKEILENIITKDLGYKSN